MANEARGSAVVVVRGEQYDKMLSLNLKRSLQDATCTGSIVLSWPGAEHFNVSGIVASYLVDGAEGVIMLDDQLAATIILDERTSKGTPKSYELTLTFRGTKSSLIDSAVKSDTGQFNRLTPADLVRKLMEGYPNADMVDVANLNKQIYRFIVNESETVERAVRRATRELGLNLFENEEGQWVLYNNANQIAKSGPPLEIGRSFTEWSVKRNLWPRAETYEVRGSSVENPNSYGDAAKFFARQNRQLFGTSGMPSLGRMVMGMVDTHQDQQTIQSRGGLEGNTRAGQGLNITLRMSTWSDANGRLWSVLTKHHVRIPVDDVSQDMIISEVEFELSRDTRRATLTLVDPGALGDVAGNLFDLLETTPQPQEEEEDDLFTVVKPILPNEAGNVPATRPPGNTNENT